MEETLHNAQIELNRADHSIYVSLKYTRTVDVIKSIIERLISTIDFCFEVLLIHAKKDKKIPAIPTLTRLRIDMIRTLYSDDPVVQNFLEFYQKLRKIDTARFDRAQEYRRHVTMTVYLDGGPVEITIDIITDYFDRTKEFFAHVKTLVSGGKND